MAMNQDGGVLLKWQISIQLCVAEEIHPSWDPTWWKCVAALSPPPFGCSNMKSGDFLMLAYTSQPVDSFEATFPENKACYFLARKSSIGGTRNFPWPWWSHGNFHRFCRGFPWPGPGRSLFSTEKWCWIFQKRKYFNVVLSWICHCERNRFCHLKVFLDGRIWKISPLGSVFLGQHEITRITRIGKGIFQKLA